MAKGKSNPLDKMDTTFQGNSSSRKEISRVKKNVEAVKGQDGRPDWRKVNTSKRVQW